MALYQRDVIEIQTKLKEVVGKKAWNVKHGIGTFITMEFGQPLPPKRPNGVFHGEWHLWVYGGAWRLEKDERIVVASEDDQSKIEIEISSLEGAFLQSFEVLTPAFDALLMFEHNIILRIFSIYSEETEDRGMDSWKLFTPDEGKVISVHPGGKWSYGL